MDAIKPQTSAASARYRIGKRSIDLLLATCLLALALPLAMLALLWRRPAKHAYFLKVAFLGTHALPYYRYQIKPPKSRGMANILRHRALLKLPVLLNILCGQLSFVGPRILSPAEAAELRALPQRFSATPGLVCLHWLRHRSNINFASENEADLEYLQTRSLRTDFAILLRALLVSVYGAPAQAHAACQQIAGIRFLNISMDELISAALIALRQKLPTKIAFVNPDCVNIAARDADYKRCLNNSDWVCADGIGMKLAGRMLGREIRQNINGTDLFPPLCAALENHAHSVYLLGGRPGVAQQVALWISAHYPGLKVSGSHDGFFSAEQEPQLIAAIRASQADVLLVAMGAPHQEKWLDRHLAATGATLGVGVGGLFDFYSGRIPRAPLWLRELGGEWIYRLLQEPGRMWRRYLIGNGVFLCRILSEKLAAAYAKGIAS